MIFIVLGMHKSGTTLVSTILHKSGINMGVNFEVGTYDTGNQYERDEMLAINMEILGATDDQTLKLKAPETWDITERQRDKIKKLIGDCKSKYQSMDWGMKDPRTSLTYPVWEEELPEHKLIMIFRPPEQIWARYRWKGWRRRYVNLWWAWHFLNRWMEYNEGVLNAAHANRHDFFVINYLDFMGDESAIEQLSGFVGRELSDQRKPSMHRSKRQYDLPLLFAKLMIRIIKRKSINKIVKELDKLSESSRSVNFNKLSDVESQT